MAIFDNSIQNLAEQATAAAWYKQTVISNNIANIETPNYNARTVNFGLALAEEMKKGERTYNPYVNVQTDIDTDTRMTLNGNNVDLEKERIALADVQYQYAALIDMMNERYKQIRTALTRS
ncbi:MAG: flagellar basal body rod protein FlgB [Ruminococcus sp.]|nr:flagellar basal body rod protein FlgB [Ruminococcus sp.]